MRLWFSTTSLFGHYNYGVFAHYKIADNGLMWSMWKRWKRVTFILMRFIAQPYGTWMNIVTVRIIINGNLPNSSLARLQWLIWLLHLLQVVLVWCMSVTSRVTIPYSRRCRVTVLVWCVVSFVFFRSRKLNFLLKPRSQPKSSPQIARQGIPLQ